MEHSKAEVVLLEAMIEKINERQLQVLEDLELTLVGGGSGDVVFA